MFEGALAASGDYRTACRIAGVSERSGRRWKRELTKVQGPTEHGREVPLTSFWGRKGELEALDHLLDGPARLITLVGPPGIGKTRLAAQWMAQTRHRTGEEEPLFFDLRSCTTGDALTAAVGRRLHVQLGDGGDPAVLVLGHVFRAYGSAFLVFDNFDDLAGHGTHAVRRWLNIATDVRFVVTSRRVLNLEGEVVFEVGPLPVPSTATANAGGEGIRDSDAVRLFLARAAALEPALDHTPPSLADVAEVVRTVEGVPLAVELAAARLRMTGTRELVNSLRGRLLSLANPYQHIDARHATLRAAIESSFVTLRSEERNALAQLSVFRGGASTESCRQVISLPAGSSPIDEILGALRESSLIRASQHDAGGRRWDLFEAIREFGDGVLDSAARREVSQRHAAHFLAAGEAWARASSGAEAKTARAQLELEVDNLRTAFQWFRSEAEDQTSGGVKHDALARMALVLGAALTPRLPALAVEALCAALQTMDGTELVNPRHGQLLLARATACLEIADYEQAETDAMTVLASEDSPEFGDTACARHLTAEARFLIGMALVYRGEANRARHALEDALASCRQELDRHLEARVHTALGWLVGESFRDPAAFVHHTQAVALMRAVGDGHGESWARTCWAVHRVFFERGDRGQEIARPAARRERDAMNAHLLWARSIVAFDAGDLGTSHALAEDAHRNARRFGVERLVAGVGFLLGPIADEREQLHEAELIYRHLIEACRELRLRFEALAHLYLSGVIARQGDLGAAESRLGQARELAQKSGDARFCELAELQQAQIAVGQARASATDGDLVGVRRWLALARKRTAEAQTPRLLDGRKLRPLARCSLEARHLIRVIEREIGMASREDLTVSVEPAGGSFRIGRGSTHVVSEGAVIRRLLAVLAEQRITAPGEPLDALDLLERCWPGERMRPEAGFRRVRDVVMRLRRVGLAGLLLRSPQGGYLLDPAVPLVLSDSAEL